MKPKENNPSSFCLAATPFGKMAVLWSVQSEEPKVSRILLSEPGASAEQLIAECFADWARSSCSAVDAMVRQIEAFTNGEDIRFPLEMVRLDLYPRFQQKVLLADYAIPRGRVSTYRLLARNLENPKGARAVGTALAKNPFPLVIPCHRVIRSNGALGGYRGGLSMKRRLLEMEGISLDDENQVVARDFFDPSLTEGKG